MERTIQDLIQDLYPLPEAVLAEVAAHFRYVEYPKNAFLLKSGRVCQHLWWMTKGACRYYYTTEEGREMNTWFSLDEQLVTVTPSFVKQVPSDESLQVLEEAAFYVIEKSAVDALLKKHHAFALWFIKLVELNYIDQVEDRIGDLQFLDAKQRYLKLLRLYPDITNRISLGHIASYLNITQETLSRVRAAK